MPLGERLSVYSNVTASLWIYKLPPFAIIFGLNVGIF